MLQKRFTLVLPLVLIMAALVFVGGGRRGEDLTLESGVLTVGMEIGYPPMEYYDADGKTPQGFDVDMAKAVAEKLGLRVEFVDTPWSDIFAGVETGKYDCVMSSVTITPERLAAHNFSKPYVGNALAMALLKNSPVTARSPQDCAGLGVSYQAKTTSETFMARLADQGVRFIPYEYERVINCFEELRQSRVDVIITDFLVALNYVSPPDSPFELVWQGPAEEKFGVCLKKGNDPLTVEINKALDALFADGTLQKISQRIFNRDLVSVARE
jgi:polar amino acid transport system substrate-binding protein